MITSTFSHALTVRAVTTYSIIYSPFNNPTTLFNSCGIKRYFLTRQTPAKQLESRMAKAIWGSPQQGGEL